MEDHPLHDPDPLAGVTAIEVLGLERSAIRTRESGVTLSAWRLSVSSSRGSGTIDRVDGSDGRVLYRGTGVFLGWSQVDLASTYRRLLPEGPGPDPDPGQFG